MNQSPTKTSSEKFQTANVSLLSLTHLLHDIYSSFLAPLRPLLMEKYGISLGAASIWDLMQRLPWLLNPFIGLLAERTAARYMVIVTPAITAISMSLLGVAPSYTVVAILLLVMGISSAVFHVPSPTMVRKVSGKYSGRGMSFYMFGGEMARTLGPLIITGAVSLWGLEGTWKLMPFGLLASFILFLKLRKIRISDDIQLKKRAPLGQAIKKMLPFFLILMGIIFFRAIMKSGLTAFLPTFYYTDKGESLWFANSALAVFQLAGAVGTLLSGTISDRIGRKTALVIITLITPVFMFLFVTSSGILSFVFLVILGFFVFAPGPVLLALVQDTSKDMPVFANSIYMTLSFGASAISVVFAGFLGDLVGLQTTYLVSGFLALGAIPFVLLLKPGK